MTQYLKVHMYHWIRSKKDPFFPLRHGNDEDEFIRQLDYLSQEHNFVTIGDIADFLNNSKPLPDRPCHLTFDEGHREHYTIALPILAARGIKATFFPNAAPTLEGRLLNVHKLHLILASHDNPRVASSSLLIVLDELRQKYPTIIPAERPLIDQFLRPGFRDVPEVNFVKRVCDTGLPLSVRDEVVHRLFEIVAGISEHEAAKRFYMNLSELQEMAAEGMTIGAHGRSHISLAQLDEPSQAGEIDSSLTMLREVYGDMPTSWPMSFPYGEYDQITLRLVMHRRCSLAFTDKYGVIGRGDNPHILPRIDTNFVRDEMVAARN